MKVKMVDIDSLVGNDEPVDPASMQYKAVAARNYVSPTDMAQDRACRGCLFDGQRARVCNQANALAVKAGMPACEDRNENKMTYIYIAVEQDPRQLSIT